MSLLILDNKDSFTYNLVESFRAIGVADITVVSGNELNQDLVSIHSKIVVGPGPGLPSEFPAIQWLFDHVEAYHNILGICLGHQAMALFFGAKLLHLDQVIHGESLPVFIESDADPLFRQVPNPFLAGLYHSWTVNPGSLPAHLRVIASLENGTIMGIRHQHRLFSGLQFHPESYMTPHGRKILQNWYF